MTAADGPVLVDTEEAAHALHLPASQLDSWVDGGLVVPARVDPDGRRWWNPHDLRRQLARHLDEEHRSDG